MIAISTATPLLSSGHRDKKVTAGRIISGLIVLALALDAGGKLLFPATMIENTPPLGLQADVGLYRLLGAILAACLGLYVWRRTSLIGAVLLTGYLGGAIAINLRAGMPLFSNTLFGAYLGVLVWGGLILRDPRLRTLIGSA